MSGRAAAHDAAERAEAPLVRCVLAELFGAFCVTFVDAGGGMAAALAPDAVTSFARAIAAGLIVIAMIYAVGPVSGAHLNPAVSFAFAARRVFPWRRLPAYGIAQLLGGLLAAIALRAALGDVDHVGTPHGRFGGAIAFTFELALVTILVSVILGTARHRAVVGANAALAVGGVVAAAGSIARPLSGASLNPARYLGPAIASGFLRDAWIYCVAPLAGALLAVAITWLLQGPPQPDEHETAQGERHGAP